MPLDRGPPGPSNLASDHVRSPGPDECLTRAPPPKPVADGPAFRSMLYLPRFIDVECSRSGSL